MAKLRALLFRALGSFRKRRREEDLAAELEAHLQLHTDDNVRRGMAPGAARRAAVLALGGVEPTKEMVRDRHALPALESVATDLRHAVRMVRRSPGFVAVATITLALGIGANSAVFSVAHKLVLEPLPFRSLDRLVAITETLPDQGLEAIAAAPADYLDWRRQATAFDAIVGYRAREMTLTGAGGDPERLQSTLVAPGFLGALEVPVLLGRGFGPDADQPGHDREVLLGHGLWQRRFAGDPSVLGSTLILDGRAVTIVGILPPYFDFPFGSEVWLPLAFTPAQAVDRDRRNVYVIARLRDDATVEKARAEMAAVAERIEREHPSGVTVRVAPLRDQQGEFARPLVEILVGMAAFLLLIACANLANLLLARATVRRKEVAVRAALGASRGRIVQQLLAESVVLFALAAAAGLALSGWAVDLIQASLPPGIARFIPGWRSIGVDPRALAATLAVALVTVLAFSLISALQASRLDLVAAFKDNGGARAASGRVRRVLVGAEVALALVLLAGAGMMVNGFSRVVRSVEVPEPERVLTMGTALPEAKYREPAAIADFYARVGDGLAALPGVREVAIASNTPLNNRPNPIVELALEGRPAVAPADRRFADLVVVTPAYFSTLGVPLLSGRSLDGGDGAEAGPVAVVSALAARRSWPGEDPVGKRFRIGASDWITVVGVVGDVRQSGFDREIRPGIYRPLAQAPRAQMTLLLRAGGDPLALAAAARARVHAVDPDLPIDEMRTLERLFSDEMSPFRFAVVLMSVFGAVALALSAIGVYGVMAYSVAQRTHEIGIRMALGARRWDVLRLVVGQSLRTAAIGVAAGLPLALAATRLMTSTLFGVVAFEPAVLVGLIVLLCAVAVAATVVPTRRAVRVDPMIALRRE